VNERDASDPVVVLVGREPDADALGAIARDLDDQGTRAAVFLGDVTDPATRAALQEMLAELYPNRRHRGGV
jgi:NAD(P)-dependent dehydrogenase (short-subunit alcohol dehydrogenase family)